MEMLQKVVVLIFALLSPVIIVRYRLYTIENGKRLARECGKSWRKKM